MLFVSLAVYGVDTFTAVNLLAFNKWSGEIEPVIDFDISKWIFSICIIASFINLGFEHVRAWRVMRRGNIAECYLDSLAVRLESIRVGKGRGFKRFLVFAELTKSKQGAEYIALFTYFSLQSWIRVLLCSGPRQVINALTLYSVYNAKLSSQDAANVGEGFLEFFRKIGALAAESYQQALILSGMVFTLVVWVFSALFLLVAVLLYVFFLWQWIPKADGGLAGYCERKVNNTLTKVVHEKVKKAFAKDEQKKMKAELKEARKNGLEKPVFGRQATLPVIADMGESTDKLPQMPVLDRVESTRTLPPYTSRPASPGSIELGAMDRKRPFPPRTATTSSTNSYGSNAPLMGNGADMGYSSPVSQPQSIASRSNYAPSIRPGTANSQRSGRPRLAQASTFSSTSEDMPPMPPPVRSPTARTFDSYGSMGGRASPAPSRGGYGDYEQQAPPRAGYGDYANSITSQGPPRVGYGDFNRTASPAPSRGGYDDFNGSVVSQAPSRGGYGDYNDRSDQPGAAIGGYGDFANARTASPAPSRPGFPELANGRASPAPSIMSDRSNAPAVLRPGPRPGQRPGPPGAFQAYQPARSATGPVPPRGPGPQYPPQRNMTAPVAPGQDDYFDRPGTSQGSQPNPPGAQPTRTQTPGDYDFDIYDSYGADPEAQRGGPRY
jgi:potassium channel KCH